MSHHEFEKVLIAEAKQLSLGAQEDVLRFIKFIKRKKKGSPAKKPAKNSVTEYRTEMDKKETLHLEEEFQDYKKLFPLEK